MSSTRLAGLLPDLRWRGLVHATTDGLEERLASGAPLRAYNGFDPTFRSLHVGHLIPIFGLVRLQRFGGQPVAVVGGGTGMIGDPSGRSSERPLLDRSAIAANVHAIRDQLAHYLDFAPGPTQALVVNNLDWLGDARLIDFLRDIGKHFTVPYMLAKDSVQVRMDKGLSFTEFSYMLLQAADFLHLHRSYGVELQCGGADQWGNITAGLELIRRTAGPRRPDAEGLPDLAHGLAYPLLLNASGAKFGKSESGESIWLDPALTSPYRFYQYWLDAEDRDVGTYLRWFTLFDRVRVEELEADQAAHPEQRGAQRALARDLTERTHGRGAADRVARVSELLFGGDPAAADAQTLADLAAEIPAAAWPEGEPADPGRPGLDLVEVLVLAGAAASRGEARRLVEQGGVHVNGRPARDLEERFTAADLLAGRFLLVRRGKRDQRVLVRGLGEGVTEVARGHVQVIAGCMFSGKTDELLRLLRRAEIARRRILLVRPTIDDRTEAEVVRSRSGAAYGSTSVKGPSEIESLAKDAWADVIAIEEAQFFPASLVPVVERLAVAGRTVILSGLNTDFRGRPFGPMPQLMAIADGITSLTAICTVCGDEATRTQRLIDGRPAGADEPVVVVGGLASEMPTPRRETYEARCRSHHELP